MVRCIQVILSIALCIILVPSAAYADAEEDKTTLFTETIDQELPSLVQILEECCKYMMEETKKKIENRKFEVIVERAQAECGKPYVWGACGPSSYDCSGLVGYCVTGEYARIGTTYTFMGWPQVAEPRPGDVCTSSSHCGIYIGDGQMIHAPQSGDVVKVGPVQSGMVYVRYPNL